MLWRNLRAPGRKDLSSAALALLHAEAGNDMSEADLRGLLGSFSLLGSLASDVPVAIGPSYSKRGGLESSPPNS
ncbi:hypothetical protein XPA_007555 [Xanthoria parietina]